MSKKSRLVRQLIERWIERYGQPPPIATDPSLMQAVLDDLGRAHAREAIEIEAEAA